MFLSTHILAGALFIYHQESHLHTLARDFSAGHTPVVLDWTTVNNLGRLRQAYQDTGWEDLFHRAVLVETWFMGNQQRDDIAHVQYCFLSFNVKWASYFTPQADAIQTDYTSLGWF